MPDIYPPHAADLSDNQLTGIADTALFDLWDASTGRARCHL